MTKSKAEKKEHKRSKEKKVVNEQCRDGNFHKFLLLLSDLKLFEIIEFPKHYFLFFAFFLDVYTYTGFFCLSFSYFFS